ncbi:MAG: hypothetical protein C0424_11455 [Sphingobacteriaceae bacterium]|nr:hypothetical protein [Sphingobacteriaceae bacterium]
MKTEKELRQQIATLESELQNQTDEMEGLLESALEQLRWKNILTEALDALLHFAPLQQLVFKSTARFAVFKIGMALFEKIKQLFGSKKSKAQ